MHEYSIVASLIDTAEGEARSRGASRIHRLFVDIGELAGVEIDLLELAFATFSDGTACDGADLEIRHRPARWSCPGCARVIAAGLVLRCEKCARPARLSQGDEIVLTRIEMETPDV